MTTHQNFSRRAYCEDPDDEIVISGISGRFPSSANVSEFAYNLYNKIDMVDDAETRWKHIDKEVPKRLGKTVNLEKFDASFFSVHNRQAHTMDPQARMLLEHAYEAVIDAGISPQAMRGSRTSVVVGACFVETELLSYEKSIKDGLALTGSARAMLANRISFGMNLHGPSFCVDTGCSSAGYALSAAYDSIRNGECDAALVGGANLMLHPQTTLQFSRLGVLSKDGYCLPLDKNARGYTRSEAVSVIFLQKRRDAKRIYANLIYTKLNNDGFKKEGLTYPSGESQIRLMKQFYEDIHLNPIIVDYVEGHSTGTKVGDPEECNTLDVVFCKNRSGPLPIGAVKSNMGHSEPTSIICSIIKSLLCFENKQIPPNIHFTEPRTDCPALVEGRLKVISEVTDFDGKYIACNSFGFGGGNCHVLLKAVAGEKINQGIPNDDLPRLVTWSGRTEEAIDTIMNKITERPLDAEFVALLQNSQIKTAPGNTYRGYGIFTQEGDGNATCINKSIENFSTVRPPIVFVYSGMGSQYSTMGRDLMKIPIFASAIEKCHAVLEPKGIDLKKIITAPDPKIFDNILNSFIGISAIQIGLTDILKAINLEPDYIVGHSFGELGCSYADGCTTAEEMILSSYSRGMASIETQTIFGSMAAVGLGYAKLKDMVPEDIIIACHNSSDSSTISGPAESVAKFVEKLKSENYFAKEVACSNIPYHSRYIAEMGPNLFKRLNEFITHPKKRSPKWISSSVPESKWGLIESQYSTAQYHTDNLLNPVLFEEACAHLPKDAITIEIAPYGLLRAIITRMFPDGQHYSLTKKNDPDNSINLLNSLGTLFQNGVDFNLCNLYPAINWPVSRTTPMISPLIKWNHREDYQYFKYDERISTDKFCDINLQDAEYTFIAGHEIDRRVLFPATGYIFLAWQAFAIQLRCLIEDIDVVFEDVKFVRATPLIKGQTVQLNVTICRATGKFDILDGTTLVVSGTIRKVENFSMIDIEVEEKPEEVELRTKDFYKELRLRGYNYQGLFRSVVTARADGLKAEVKWNDNWIAFLDNLLQLQIIANDTRSLFLPTGLRRLVIKPKECLQAFKENDIVPISCSAELTALRCPGIEMMGMMANSVSRRLPPGVPVLESYQFVPHFPTPVLSNVDMGRFCVQLALENHPTARMIAVEVDSNDGKEPLVEFIGSAVGDLPLVTSDLSYITQSENELPSTIKKVTEDITTLGNDLTFVIKSNCLGDFEFLETIAPQLNEIGYVISRESSSNKKSHLEALPTGYGVVAVIPLEDELIALIRYVKTPKMTDNVKAIQISMNDDSLPWLSELQEACKNGIDVIAFSEKEELSGIIGLVNCIRKEPNGNKVRCVFIDDPHAPPFCLENSFYKTIIDQGLAINVLRNGTWGSYKHLLLTSTIEPARYASHLTANTLQRGDLSAIKWMHGIFPYAKPEGRIVDVHYSSLNFRDVMLATGKLAVETCGKTRLDHQCILGFEYSGIDQNGKRVMGMVIRGALATQVEVDSTITWDVPDEWTLEEAATVVVVYATVYVALFFVGQMEKGKSVLIHAGSGGVGLAAIRVAFAYGLEVFTTVSTEEKKNYLLQEFPQLKPENIGNSRDTSFEIMVKKRTKGRGVDYVLNSLAEDKLIASIKCLAKGGKFLEIGKFDMANDNKIGLQDFLKELSFHAILVDNLIQEDYESKMKLNRIMQQDINRGIIKPLKTNVFKASEIEQAFRFLASGKHVGKVILQLKENETDSLTVPLPVLPRVYCYSDRSYVIPGGLGGFGLELADWLVMRGCRNIVLSSSRGMTKPYQSYRINIWKSYGVNVVICTADIGTRAGCEELIRTAKKLGPVGGIFNLAVVLRDSILENQDTAKFIESMIPKALATKYLDDITRVSCPQLQYFVVFSSVSCGRGNAGQSNYGMSNSIMERIVEQRHKDGLPAKAIQWGAVGEVGLVADMQEDKLDLEIGGTLQQRISSCLEELDPLILSSSPIVGSMVVAEKRYSGGASGNIIETIMNVMSIKDIKSISFETTLAALGMDSLMTVEIQQILERDYSITIPAQELRSMTLSQLQKCVSNKSVDSAEVKVKHANTNIPKGVALLMRNLGDEENSKQKILKLESRADKGFKVLIIPGMEGMAGKSWYNIAKNLDNPTYILQTGHSWNARNINEIYDSVINEVLELFRDDHMFFLVGYSFGTLLTMKIASALEELGKFGKIVCVDGAPKFLKKLSNEYLPQNFTEDDVRGITLVNTIYTCYPDDDGTVVKAVLDVKSWDDRIKKFIELYPGEKPYSEEYGVHMLNALVNRIMLTSAMNLNEFPSIKCASCVLIRTTEPTIAEFENDYGLGDYFLNGVNVMYLEGNHATVLDNAKLSETINGLW